MPFEGPHPYTSEIKNGATVELDGRVIGHLQGVVPQADGRHVLRLIASVDIPFTRLVTLPVEWIQLVTPERVVMAGVTNQHIADRPTYHPMYSPLPVG
jgi:hypothetical protein